MLVRYPEGCACELCIPRMGTIVLVSAIEAERNRNGELSPGLETGVRQT